ncbi:MAG: flagellar protein FlaG [Burkholderiales bacterium]|nr:flagellar protein FlaG [Burkholderiales bacterium]
MAAVPFDTAPVAGSGAASRAEAPAPAAPRPRPAPSPAPGQAAPVALEQAGTKALEAAASRIREHLRFSASALEFSFDDDSGRAVLRIMDSETGALIRQIPSEEALAIARALDRVAGVLLHDQA